MTKIIDENEKKELKKHYKMRALRLALGVSQAEIGELVGVSATHIDMYERGLKHFDMVESEVYTALSDIRDKYIEKYGYWYDIYIELKTDINVLDIWVEFEGHAPTEIIKKAKESASAFVHI